MKWSDLRDANPKKHHITPMKSKDENFIGQSEIEKQLNKAGRALSKFESFVDKTYNKYIPATINALYNIKGNVNNSRMLALSNMMIGKSFKYDSIRQAMETNIGGETESILGKQNHFVYANMSALVDRAYEPNEIIKECSFFNFYGNEPYIKIADPYKDSYTLHKNDVLFYFEGNHTLHDKRLNLVYAESEDGLFSNHSIQNQSSSDGTYTSNVESFNSTNTVVCDLIKKTNSLFRYGEMQTLISRFHTNTLESRLQDNPTQTANSQNYGLSHGRNLLKLETTNENTYDNPYCRVWTNHHQYNTYKDIIRPFIDNNTNKPISQGDLENEFNWKSFRTQNGIGGKSGGERLDQYGVLNNSNGLVNIAPTVKIDDYFNRRQDSLDLTNIKRCMFSIENLAWKDFAGNERNEYDPMRLSAEQQGPFGGRIMWFPPYGLSFSENVSVGWNEYDFIGRGEKIYSYKNTDRGGQLSFNILIDHPSVLDYWSRQDQNGRELDTGNYGGVDNKQNEENTLLRFFAGCGNLFARNQEFKYRELIKKEEPQKEEEEPQPKPQEDPVTPPEPSTKSLICMLFYPNNYSGRKDDNEFAIEYLMNGAYAQKGFADSGNGNTSIDVPTDVTKKLFDSNESQVGGYEVRDVPVSFGHHNGTRTTPIQIANMKKCMKYKNVSLPKYTELASVYNNGSDKDMIVHYDGDDTKYVLTKQIGDKAIASPSYKTKKGSIVPNSDWYYKRWYYRVDEDPDVTNQVLPKKENYIDKQSYRFNSIGYTSIKSENLINIEIPETGYESIKEEDSDWISFTDLYVAGKGDKGGVKDVLSNLYDDDRVNLAKKVLNEEDGLQIKDVFVIGYASRHGQNKVEAVNERRNITLADGRRDTLKSFVSNTFPKTSSKIRAVETKVETGKSVDPNVDDKYRKAWRSAAVIITYTENTGIENEKNEQIVTEKVGENKTINKTWVSNSYQNGNVLRWQSNFKSSSPFENLPPVMIDTPEDPFIIHEETVNRYDNEGEFFQQLKTQDPVLHSLIADKIKYFDPAFHSISPEGFNSRLTFLHQCTRQGPTRGATDSNAATANNLAFGRPPVCVLRIGDFYYTKIIIQSMNITYDPLQWDLNQEGIGVMPMIAKVDLTFKFIGGSDLAGPISRLQNALSFNYYANTSVYDNRAEQIKYDKYGNPEAFKPYDPTTERNIEDKYDKKLDIYNNTVERINSMNRKAMMDYMRRNTMFKGI